jgi:hypothetical protein
VFKVGDGERVVSVARLPEVASEDTDENGNGHENGNGDFDAAEPGTDET